MKTTMKALLAMLGVFALYVPAYSQDVDPATEQRIKADVQQTMDRIYAGIAANRKVNAAIQEEWRQSMYRTAEARARYEYAQQDLLNHRERMRMREEARLRYYYPQRVIVEPYNPYGIYYYPGY